VDFNQSHVRGDAVAWAEEHDVVRNQFKSFNVLPPSFPQYHYAPRQQITKSIASLIRAVLLNEREQAIEYNNDEDRESELWHAGQNGQTAGNPQHDRKEMYELG
jgi:hypothetical protein